MYVKELAMLRTRKSSGSLVSFLRNIRKHELLQLRRAPVARERHRDPREVVEDGAEAEELQVAIDLQSQIMRCELLRI